MRVATRNDLSSLRDERFFVYIESNAGILIRGVKFITTEGRKWFDPIRVAPRSKLFVPELKVRG